MKATGETVGRAVSPSGRSVKIRSGALRNNDYPWFMKRIILLLAIAAIAAIIYKILTSEIPLEES
jgi:hypothetical protein